MLPASRAACVPVCMATPTSAWASAGASLVPSPHMAMRRPPGLLLADVGELVLRRRLGEEVVDAGLRGDRRGGERIVAGHHDGADAHGAQRGEALLDAGLDDVLQMDDAEQPAVRRRRPAACRPSVATRSTAWRNSAGVVLERRRRGSAGSNRPRLCGSSAGAISTPEMRVWAAKGMTLASGRIELGLGETVVALGERDDRAAFRRLVGEAGERARPRRGPSVDAGDRQELRRHAVAEGDRAGLVEQQRVDVARRLDRAARGGDDVEADQPVHAGDADRGQEAADGRRDQADEQRDQHGRREVRRRNSWRSARASRRRSGRSSVRPDSRIDSASSFGVFCRSAPSTSAIMRSMKVEPGAAVILHLDEVGENRRAAGDRRAVAAGLADDGRGFAGDRRFVDRGDAFDDLAVAGDDLAGLDQHDVAAA